VNSYSGFIESRGRSHPGNSANPDTTKKLFVFLARSSTHECRIKTEDCYMKSLSLFLALSLAAAVTAQAQKKSEKEVTVKGEVVVDHIAQTERGPYARIAILRPHDGHTVDFEAGYIRHLEWHRQARDTWVWYG
jgi:hypothetical protein